MSVLLTTDVVYDVFFPYLLKGQATDIYIPLIRFFMDNSIMKLHKETPDKIMESRMNFLASDSYASVTDDKTLVVLINGDVEPAVKHTAFYAEPDWDALQKEWNKKAYPHLFIQNSTKERDIGNAE